MVFATCRASIGPSRTRGQPRARRTSMPGLRGAQRGAKYNPSRLRTSNPEKLVPIGIPSDLVTPRVDGVRILHAPSAKPHASAPWGRSQPCSAECTELFIASCCRAIVVIRCCQTAAASSMLMSEPEQQHRASPYALQCDKTWNALI